MRARYRGDGVTADLGRGRNLDARDFRAEGRTGVVALSSK